jgi:hypothetical protein
VKQTNSIVNFILFLEEFFLWSPGGVSSLFERLFSIILKSIDKSLPYKELASLINPFLCYILFVSSATNIAAYLISIFNERAKADILIWLERNKYIRVVLVAIFALIFILQVLDILDAPSMTLLALYQDKGLWILIFFYMFIKRFLSEKNWS